MKESDDISIGIFEQSLDTCLILIFCGTTKKEQHLGKNYF
jgi:hypothetical protein